MSRWRFCLFRAALVSVLLVGAMFVFDDLLYVTSHLAVWKRLLIAVSVITVLVVLCLFTSREQQRLDFK